MKSLTEYASQLVAQSHSGTLDYYVEVCRNHKKAINLFSNHIAEQDATIAALKTKISDLERRNQHLTDRVLRFALGKPQDISPGEIPVTENKSV